jgi:integrase
MSASCVQNAINALRALYASADLLTSGAIRENPTANLRLPARRGKRDRVASVQEAIALIGALPAGDRAVWGTAFWAALRHGELKALTWDDIDLARGILSVHASWDQQAGRVAPKSRAGERQVPIVGRLRDLLLEHRMMVPGGGLVFGRSPSTPFQSGTLNARARRAWNAAGLLPIGLHDARHTAASFWIAAGLNLKTVSVYMGHASVAFTMDRYGHLLPGSEVESVQRIDAFIAAAEAPPRIYA